MPWNSRKHPLCRTEFIAHIDTFTYAKEHLYPSYLHTPYSILEISYQSTLFKYSSTLKYYLKVLQACLCAVENTHLMKPNQFIASMDVYPYAKKLLHTSSFWNIILKNFNIKALTFGLPWHNLDKKATLNYDSYGYISACKKIT